MKSVARTMAAYEDLGVGAVLIEDQLRERKQQCADKAAAFVGDEVIESKLRAALALRSSPETLVIGRTDAYGALGLDTALRRAERYLKLGVDGVFIAGLWRSEDYERVGPTLHGALLSAAIFEGPEPSWPSPRDLGAMGFGHVSFPVTVLLRSVAAVRSGLAALRHYEEGQQVLDLLADAGEVRAALDQEVELVR